MVGEGEHVSVEEDRVGRVGSRGGAEWPQAGGELKVRKLSGGIASL